MKILLINSAPHTDEFIKPIVRTLTDSGTEVEQVNYKNIPCDLDLYDGIIISASPRGDDIIHAHIPWYQWIKNTIKPVLGICHGHQLIGVMYGADLIRDEQSEEGIHSVNIQIDTPLFAGFNRSFKVEQHHNNSITLPDEFKLLASSTRCKVQAMVHKERPIYTVQFHGEKNPEIIMNFVEIVKSCRLHHNQFS